MTAAARGDKHRTSSHLKIHDNSSLMFGAFSLFFLDADFIAL